MNALFLTPIEISKAIRDISKTKAAARKSVLFLSGILAGMYIAFGACAAIAVLSGGTLDAGLAKFLAGSVFSVGLMLVLIPGSELFTGNILMVIGFVYRKHSLNRVLRNWTLVYAGNFLGSVAIAWLMFYTGLLNYSGGLTAAGAVAVNIAETKIQLGFTEALCRGILCNMLVCLAVIMCISSKTVAGKIFGIYFPIMAFVASGFEHSIANMYFLPVGLMIKGEFISNFFTMFNNLIPVTLGNIIGGLSIVLLHPKTREKITHIFRKKSEKY
ncbi:MAG: formate/nitrite transporter family protein [Candidatus Omnitrophica bacterium]|nr:formate/nitrite transporter family protein [Candidatus Omnitrophota bacterium]